MQTGSGEKSALGPRALFSCHGVRSQEPVPVRTPRSSPAGALPRALWHNSVCISSPRDDRPHTGGTRMYSNAYRLAGMTFVSLAFAVSASVSAQLLQRKDLSYAIAKTIAEVAVEDCKARGYAV